ncbi:carboxypeptidase-like regulatory domain-containing protein [Xanthovirga aplysinae]|uniref:carboxypeptidase-like regulatory domain-containing protein n=1 Tax=Xanthovirga aplysinae TaxID=2529853 RepID=UPI001CA3E928|nr:carboxypeptidase-like regulatory domain-containing protein [Xanthovirga aplysinae]
MFVFLFSCTEETVDPDFYGFVNGKVVIGNSEEGISGAKITTSPATEIYYTEEDGTFFIDSLKTGEYFVIAEMEGFKDSRVNVIVSEDEVEEVTLPLSVEKVDNTAPQAAVNIAPEHESNMQERDLELIWSAFDADTLDQLYFDVYLFTSGSTQREKIAENQTDTTLMVTSLQFDTDYFWYVVTKDQDTEIISETWSFKTLPYPDNPIFFASDREGSFDIYSAQIDGESLTRLTDWQALEWEPKMSPRGDLLAFISNKETEPHIYTMTPQGQDVKRVTTLPVTGNHNNGVGFSWSPDGKFFLYSNKNKLYRIDRDGTNLDLIATAPVDRHFRRCDWKDFGTKGQLIVVETVGLEPYDTELYTMNPDGSNQQLLVDNLPGIVESPVFSLDGSKVMYTVDQLGRESADGRQLDAHIMVINLSDNQVTDLSMGTNGDVDTKPIGTNDLYPRFSSDGSKVIFVNVTNNDRNAPQVWMMNANDGSNRELLFDNATTPSWY